CRWPKRRRARVIGELEKLADAANDAEPVFYVDEVDIHLNPKIGRDWMPRGLQRRIVTPGKNEKHYVAGALDARTRELVTVDAPKKNSMLFCKLVEQLVAAYPTACRLHLILDNYIVHSSKITRRFLAKPRRPSGAALPAAIQPGPQPHRASLARPARERHAQPPLSHHAAAARARARLPP